MCRFCTLCRHIAPPPPYGAGVYGPAQAARWSVSVENLQKRPLFFVHPYKSKIVSRFILTCTKYDAIMSTIKQGGIYMVINEIIIDVMKNTTNEEGATIRQTEIIERIKDKFGLEVTQAAFSDRLKNKNMKTNTVIEILDVLGYEVVIRPKKGNRQEYVAERGEGRSK